MQPWLLTSVHRARRVFKLHLFHAIEPLPLHTQARKPAELPRRAANQIRVGHRPDNRQGARPRHLTDAARPRRRGDRVRRLEFMALLGARRDGRLQHRQYESHRIAMISRISFLLNASTNEFRSSGSYTGSTNAEGPPITCSL
jgi:hypothetical protein